MTEEQNSWNSRLLVTFTPTNSSGAIISPINNFNATVQTPHDIIDSIDGDNLGYSVGNRRINLDFEVTALNKVVFRRIVECAIKGAEFSITLGHPTGASADWFVDTIVFDRCVVTDTTPVTISNDGKAPTMKITAVALNVSLGQGIGSLYSNQTSASNNTISS
jgi:hypothetical protein